MKLMRITTFKVLRSPLILGAFLAGCATGGELTAEEVQYLKTGVMPGEASEGGDTGTASGVGSSSSAPTSTTGSTTPPELVANGNGSAPSSGIVTGTLAQSGGTSSSSPQSAGSPPISAAGGANLEIETAGGSGGDTTVGAGGQPSSGRGGMGGNEPQGPGGSASGGTGGPLGGSGGEVSAGGTTSGGSPSTGHCMEGWEGKAGDTCSTQTQMDLAKCADFIQCYIDNDCGPSTCGANDDECGVNSGLGSSSPKMIADQTVKAICPSL